MYLRNYRVFEGEHTLELPGGLIGVYGPNGSGKSALLESLLWSLYGRSRTDKAEIRTTGVNAECITEVEFEHEGHLYQVRRVISGINATVKAEAFADGHQVATTVGDVRRYVHSVLGMDDAAFRSSVFAEQKQVAAFSGKTPSQRRDLVLRLLGITPLDAARQAARDDARIAREAVDRVRAALPNLEDLRAIVERKTAEAERLTAEADAERAVLDKAVQRAAEAGEAFAKLDELRQEHQRLLDEGRAVRAELDDATARVERLMAELAELERGAAELKELQPVAERTGDLRAAHTKVAAVEAAQAELAALPPATDAIRPPDESAVDARRSLADEARAELARALADKERRESDLARAEEQLARSATLSDDEECGLCGQPLGEAFERVQAHREEELASARDALAVAVAQVAAHQAKANEAGAALDAAVQELAVARTAWEREADARVRRETAATRLESAIATLGREPASGEAARLATELAAAEHAAQQVARLTGVLARLPAAAAELERETAKRDDARGRREVLLAKVDSLAFKPEAVDAAASARDEAVARVERAKALADDARVAVERSKVQVQAAVEEFGRAEQQHASIAVTAEDARHRGRVADLLNAFRTNVIGTVGPRLAAHAASLFAELTDHEYDLLKVNPEDFGIEIVDAGISFDMERFSGSEIDLANLALRVAVSEHVRFQSGGAVGLLVLDEVFGPLDADRRERMLLALERLRARFRQVLVVTHADEIKEQLPNAVEVVKLPGRRASLRMVTA